MGFFCTLGTNGLKTETLNADGPGERGRERGDAREIGEGRDEAKKEGEEEEERRKREGEALE